MEKNNVLYTAPLAPSVDQWASDTLENCVLKPAIEKPVTVHFLCKSYIRLVTDSGESDPFAMMKKQHEQRHHKHAGPANR
jgi:hypothetical protein